MKLEETNDEVKDTDVERYVFYSLENKLDFTNLVCYLSNKTIDLMKCCASNRKTYSSFIQYLDKGRHVKCFTDNFWFINWVSLPSKLIWLKRT